MKVSLSLLCVRISRYVSMIVIRIVSCKQKKNDDIMAHDESS